MTKYSLRAIMKKANTNWSFTCTLAPDKFNPMPSALTRNISEYLSDASYMEFPLSPKHMTRDILFLAFVDEEGWVYPIHENETDIFSFKHLDALLKLVSGAELVERKKLNAPWMERAKPIIRACFKKRLGDATGEWLADAWSSSILRELVERTVDPIDHDPKFTEEEIMEIINNEYLNHVYVEGREAK